jgi:hypothetical protein
MAKIRLLFNTKCKIDEKAAIYSHVVLCKTAAGLICKFTFFISVVIQTILATLLFLSFDLSSQFIFPPDVCVAYPVCSLEESYVG